MKYGICLEMFFKNLAFIERIKRAGDTGFKYSEMWFIDGTFNGTDCSSDPKDPEDVRRAARDAGITITNAVIGSPDGQLGGGLTNPKNRREWLKRAELTFQFCKEAHIGAVIVCTGNVQKGMSLETQKKSILKGLRSTAKLAKKYNITLLLEPLNTPYDHPGYFLGSSDEGAALCRKVNSANMKLLYDCYHMQIMEGDLIGHIKRNFDVIGHFHSAGHPGRHELYLGEINYPYLVSQIEKMGYKGVFGFEYMPTLNDKKSLKRTLKYLEGQ